MLGKFIILLAVISTMFFSSCTGIPFDSEKWKNWKEGEADMGEGLRWKMVDNLLGNYELKGMNIDEIKQLLGTKYLSRTLTWPDCSDGSCTISYYLGECGHFEDGSLSLVFENGVVVEVEKICG